MKSNLHLPIAWFLMGLSAIAIGLGESAEFWLGGAILGVAGIAMMIDYYDEGPK